MLDSEFEAMLDDKVLALLSPDQQKALKIEAIFMPEARRQRDRLHETNDPRFVHYTRAEAALEIIRQKRIWLRNTTAMDDYGEVQHGFRMLVEFFGNRDKRAAFIAAFDAVHKGAAQEALDLFDGWWVNPSRGLQTQTYIASISEHDRSEDRHGRLSMWRAFGTSAAARVALVFRVPPFSGAMDFLNCVFSPVAYLNKERAHEIVAEVIANVTREGEFLRTLSRTELVHWVFWTLVLAVACVKHEGFREEREWRIVFLPGLMPAGSVPLLDNEIRAVGGLPQVIYKLPIDVRVAPELAQIDLLTMFDRIIIGPSAHPWVMYDAFTRALGEAGVHNASDRVITSDIPLRTL
jgi:Protein of unknown function (DUF2971)